MSTPQLPLIVEPEELERQLGQESILVVDLCKPEIYAQSHIPGAVHLDYAQIVAVNKPVMGLLPNESQLNEVFSSIGLTPEHHVVAYDDEGGGRASRLLWTLEAMGHTRFSLLNGGLHAWTLERRALKSGTETRARSQYRVQRRETVIADKSLHTETPGGSGGGAAGYALGRRVSRQQTLRRARRAYSGRGQSRLAANHGSRPRLAFQTGGGIAYNAHSTGRDAGQGGGVLLPEPPPLGAQLHDAQEPGVHARARVPRFMVGLGQQPGYTS